MSKVSNEDQVWVPSTSVKKKNLGVVMCIYNPQAEIDELQTSGKPCLKNKQKGKKHREKYLTWTLTSMCTCV